LHFHSNVTVILHNNGFVAVSITMVTAVQKHYYCYGSVIDIRESFRDSCVLGSEEKGRSGVIVVISRCVLESKQVGRVLAGCDFRS
jgi:hypothetical protein